MDITIHSSMLPMDDSGRDAGLLPRHPRFEVRLDVGKGTMRWITVRPPNSLARLLFESAGREPGYHRGRTTHHRRDDGQRHLRDDRSRHKDLDGVFERLQATNADIVQEPTSSLMEFATAPCAIRLATLIRIQEVS